MARYNVDLQDNEGNAYQIMANPDSVAEFSPAANRENIRSGETYRVIFGKIMKYLSEVGNAAYVGLANNCTTTIAGFALDARQGKELMDRINELNRDLGRVNVYVGSDGKLHFVNSGGADSVLPFNNKPAYYTVSTGRELAVSTYAEESIKITIPDRDGKTAVGGYITNIRVYNSNGDLQEAPIRCNYANKVLTVISSAGKWSSGWTAYYFDVVGIYI